MNLRNMKQQCGIEVYSSEFCGYCKKTEAFFKKHGVSFCKMDVTSE